MKTPIKPAVVALWMLASACTHRPVQSAASRAADTSSSAGAPQKTLAEWFQGRAGVEVQQVNGGVKLRIRSRGEWDGRSDPLFVIDGVSVTPPGGVLIMNPNDIAGVEILKDDASTAIYGLAGANGVVKITTRRK